MNNIVILGGSDQQIPLLKEAKKRRYKVFLIDQDVNYEGRKLADVFFREDIHEKNYKKLYQIIKQINPSIVTSIASDVAVRTVNKLVEALDLSGNSYETAVLTTDKGKMKEKLLAEGLPTTKSFLIDKNSYDLKEFDLPLMVKASDRSGGRGVTYVETNDALYDAINCAFQSAFNGKVLIEGFFDGQQYSVETISNKRKHQIIGITEEFFTGKPDFVERQQLFPARLNIEVLSKIEELVFKLLDTMDIQTGACHVELRINSKGDLNIIEIASRMGGDFRHELIKSAKGISYVGLLMDALEGKDLNVKSKKNGHSLIHWACSKKDYDRIKELAITYEHILVRNKLKNDNFNSASTAKNGTERYGYTFYTSNSFEQISKLIF